MTVIGITGPSGAGKGFISRILSDKYGFAVLDADVIYHSLVSSPSKCLDEIRMHFGNGVITSEGSLDRRALSELVFGEENKEKLELLNKITHKHVVNEIDRTIESIKQSTAVCVIDAPLLVEAGLCERCDFTISVIAPKKTRAERISLRDNISLLAAQKRIASQKSDDFYTSNTDYSINNDGGDISLLGFSIKKILCEKGVSN